VWRKEDAKSQGVPEISTTPAAAPVAPAPNGKTNSAPAPVAAPVVSPNAAACISQGIRIKGEVTGKEDLFIDGIVDGKLELGGASVTVGPNGTIKADVTAREVIVRGTVTGKISAKERVQLWNTGRVEGEVQTDRIAIEDGAVLRGKVEAGRPLNRANEAGANSAAAVAAAGSGKAAL